ncbi:MAG: 50S ribosomal protein L14e [Candidatus Micrarchaeota archaeon]|nr:50S ribosomal protein L14e [Candidatus Micrarchaeota archaeon]
MALLEEGRVCIKKFGRDAGDKAVVTKVVDQNFVMIISSTRPRERKSNIKHLEFINETVDVKDKARLAKTLEIEESKLGAAPKSKPAASAQKPAPKQEQKAKK